MMITAQIARGHSHESAAGSLSSQKEQLNVGLCGTGAADTFDFGHTWYHCASALNAESPDQHFCCFGVCCFP